MQTKCGLLIFGFDRNEAHVRATDSFTNGLGIVVVVLAALAIGSDETGRDDPGIVAEPGKLPGPVMGARTGFHANQARWQLCEERQQFWSIQSFANQNLAVLIGAVNTEHSFRQIDANGCNIYDDSSCFRLKMSTPSMWHIDAVGAGGVHIIR